MNKKHTPLHLLPEGYAEFLSDLKRRIKESQLKAAISANRELILLYWDIGRQILERQDKEGWGAKIIDRLSTDLKHEFPEMTGFSPRNLKYMRKLAALYPDIQIVQQAVAQIPWGHIIRLKTRIEWTMSITGNHSEIKAVPLFLILKFWVQTGLFAQFICSNPINGSMSFDWNCPLTICVNGMLLTFSQ